MTAPDPDGRSACCGAPSPGHWVDCPKWEWMPAGYWRSRDDAEASRLAHRFGPGVGAIFDRASER